MTPDEIKKKMEGLMEASPLDKKKVIIILDSNKTHIGFSLMGFDKEGKNIGKIYDTELHEIEDTTEDTHVIEVAQIIYKAMKKSVIKKGYIA